MEKCSIRLKRGKETFLEHRHLWIFSGAIESYPDRFEDGEIYPICSYQGEVLAHGYFHRKMSLCGRIVSFGAQAPWDAIYRHIDASIQLRDQLFDPSQTNAFRLINGEGDFLPGLVIDQYGHYLVLQSGSLGVDRFKEKIVDYLIQKKRWKGIFEKSASSSRREEKLANQTAILWGEPQPIIEILENGISFQINWEHGQKTGFFLDQREMRKKVQDLSKDRRVFNCFCYSGAFSLYALKGGAKKVDSLDISSDAIDLAKSNFIMNGLLDQRCGFFQTDAFDFLAKEPLDYDLVILDPPAFAKKKQDIPQAMKGYREINYRALCKMPAKSFLLTCSCSYHIDETTFQTVIFQAAKKAQREVQIVSRHIQAMDHPVNIFHPETHYLKSLLLYVYD